MSKYHSVIRCSSNECKLCCIDRDCLTRNDIFIKISFHGNIKDFKFL